MRRLAPLLAILMFTSYAFAEEHHHRLLPAPTGLNATAGNKKVTLTWTASKGAAWYRVKRSHSSGGPYKHIVSTRHLTFTDSDVSIGRTYYYVVQAAAWEHRHSENSAEVSATVNGPTNNVGTPSGLTAIAGNAQVSLSWSAASGATSYRVKRSTTSGGPYTQIGTPAGTNFTDKNVNNGTTYFYVVSAMNKSNESAIRRKYQPHRNQR